MTLPALAPVISPRPRSAMVPAILARKLEVGTELHWLSDLLTSWFASALSTTPSVPRSVYTLTVPSQRAGRTPCEVGMTMSGPPASTGTDAADNARVRSTVRCLLALIGTARRRQLLIDGAAHEVAQRVRVHRSVPGVEHLLFVRSEEHTSELQSRLHLVCRLLLEKKKKKK